MSSLYSPLSVPLTQLQHSSWGLEEALRLRTHYLGPNASLPFVASGKNYASITSAQGKGIMEAARGRAARTRRKTYLSVLSLLVK